MELEDNIIEYCIYCKEIIYNNQKYITCKENKYHLECYKLIEDELEESDDEQY